MSDHEPPLNEDQPTSGTLRGLFPGYFAPTVEELKVFLAEGMVVFDTNALFDVYRLHGTARQEYLGTLRRLGDRLWIPHQVGLEFVRNRPTVIQECLSYTETLGKQATTTVKALQELGRRRGFSTDQIARMEKVVNGAVAELTQIIEEIYDFGVDLHATPDDDEIFQAVERIIDHRTGCPLPDTAAARRDAERRIKDKTPPGYKDKDKSPEKQFGDYLLWAQTIEEAKRRKLPVLLVSNEEKEDWVREEHGQRKGPRPELVEEMLRDTGQPFHLVTVRSFLVHAKTYLSATVSDSTVEQAEQLQAEPLNAFQSALLTNTVIRDGDVARWAQRVLDNDGASPLVRALLALSVPQLSNLSALELGNHLGPGQWLPRGRYFEPPFDGNDGPHVLSIEMSLADPPGEEHDS